MANLEVSSVRPVVAVAMGTDMLVASVAATVAMAFGTNLEVASVSVSFASAIPNGDLAVASTGVEIAFSFPTSNGGRPIQGECLMYGCSIQTPKLRGL